MDKPNKLENSEEEQEALRAVALWAVESVEKVLPLFENQHPNETRPREAVAATEEFGQGKKRDKNLRIVAMACFKIVKDIDDEPSKYVAQAASLVAAIAYTHTDLQAGIQGVRQARHILGPVVYAALAIETSGADSNALISQAIDRAPSAVRYILSDMPHQPEGAGRLDELFSALDSTLRDNQVPG